MIDANVKSERGINRGFYIWSLVLRVLRYTYEKCLWISKRWQNQALVGGRNGMVEIGMVDFVIVHYFTS